MLNGLLKNFTLSEDRRGFLFEHFIVNQILTANFLLGEPARLSTYRTEAGVEVDLVVEKDDEVLCVEIKAGPRVSDRDLSGLRRFAAGFGRRQSTTSILLYAGNRAYKDGAIAALPWRSALDEVFDFLT